MKVIPEKLIKEIEKYGMVPVDFKFLLKISEEQVAIRKLLKSFYEELKSIKYNKNNINIGGNGSGYVFPSDMTNCLFDSLFPLNNDFNLKNPAVKNGYIGKLENPEDFNKNYTLDVNIKFRKMHDKHGQEGFREEFSEIVNKQIKPIMRKYAVENIKIDYNEIH